METPKGDKHPHPTFAKLPEIETFAKNDRERKMLALQRGFRVTGTPFVLPPGTPKDRVDILKEAFRKTYLDPEFAKILSQTIRRQSVAVATGKSREGDQRSPARPGGDRAV
jgi:hypothetical protein